MAVNSSFKRAGPETITASVPFSAPAGPPLTGASTATMPFSSRPLATSIAIRGPVVDKSMNVLTLLPATTPFDAKRDRLDDIGRRQTDHDDLGLRGDIGRRMRRTCAFRRCSLQGARVGIVDDDLVTGRDQAA